MESITGPSGRFGAWRPVPAAQPEWPRSLGEETFAGTSANGQDAPIPAIRW